MRHDSCHRLIVASVRNRLLFAAIATMTPAWCCHGGAVVTDGSVGAHATLSGPTFNIPASLGQQKGGNLFHSFSTFNLSPGEVASFSGPANVGNVIARVTGGASNINGTLRCTIPNANFFLIDPKGVIFGPDASLDVKGSFVVTTADYLKLADGSHFNATTLADTTLSSAAPAAFGFLAANAPAIQVNGSTLAPPAKQSLSLIGGNIQIVNGRISAPGGRVNLISTASVGELTVDATSLLANIDLSPTPTQLGDIVLSQNTLVSTDGPAGGRISIRGANLEMSGSTLSAGTTDASAGLGIDIVLSGNLSLLDSEILTDPIGTGKAGPISVNADAITIDSQGDHSLTTGISAQGTSGAGGTISVTANTLTMLNSGMITAAANGPADAGAVSVNAGSLSLTGGAEITAEARASSMAGSVAITGGSITIDDQGQGNLSGLFADTSSTHSGPGGGQISINADSLTLSNGALVSASSFNAADAGNMTITLQHGLSLTNAAGSGNSAIAVVAGGAGNAGSIRISADTTEVGPFSIIDAATSSTGRGGAINLTGTTLNIDGGSVAAQTVPDLSSLPAGAVPGDGGNITLNVNTLSLSNGGTLNAGTSGPGSGGKINIAAATITADGSGSTANTGIFVDSTVNPGNIASIGPAGTITIQGSGLTLSNGAAISASTAGQGAGGNISVSLTGALSIDGGTSTNLTGILTNAQQQGIAGNISVNADYIGLANNSTISSSGGGAGAAGAVTVTANTMLIQTGASISSDTAGSGAGGNVNVKVLNSLVIDGQDVSGFTGISADSLSTGAGGNAGQVMVTTEFLTIKNTGRIATNTLGLGAGGNIIVNGGTIVLDESPVDRFTGISALSESTGLGGRGGDVTVNASTSLHISNGARISTETFGLGDGGNIFTASPTITLDNPGDELAGGIVADSDSNGAGGHAGNISISANTLNIASTGEISSGTFGLGDGGNITVGAKQIILDAAGTNAASLALFGESLTGISASSQSSGAGGKAGDVTITANAIQVLHGAQISSATFGLGAGGSVNITTNSLIVAGQSSFDSTVGSTIGATSENNGPGGDAGTVRIKAGGIGIFDAGEINDQTVSTGKGGAIVISAQVLELDNGAAVISSSDGAGTAGMLSLHLNRSLSLSRNSTISTAAGTSTGGGISMFVGHKISLGGDSSITAQAGGEGGSIDIQCPGIIYLADSDIFTQAGNNGGNMRVDPSFVVLQNSRLSANGGNNGGDITVHPTYLLQSQSAITATGARGVGGSLQITPQYNLTGALLSLPTAISDNLTLQPQCAADLPGSISSFILTGRGAPPLEPGGWLTETELRLPLKTRRK